MKWIAIGAALLCASAAQVADYSKMAPVDQYMMNRDAEIALAKSAAPPAIADKATVWVLTPHGYETAVKGSNGFVCLVERAWMASFDFPKFWDQHTRGPLCYNPPGVRSILPYTVRRTELVLAGRSRTEIEAAIRDGIAKHALPHLEDGAMTYMMSKQQILNDGAHPNWVPHLMFYFAGRTGTDWGADLPGAPPMLNTQMTGPEDIAVIMVPVTHWSDGTPAPAMH
jgi:hypothetical protein